MYVVAAFPLLYCGIEQVNKPGDLFYPSDKESVRCILSGHCTAVWEIKFLGCEMRVYQFDIA